MRKVMRFALTFAVMASLMLAAGVQVCAFDISGENPETGFNIIIDDAADLFTPAQEEALAAGHMAEISADGGVAVITTEVNPYASSSSYAKARYRELFGTDSGTLFLIDMYEREIYLFSDGNIYRTVTKSYANTITDNVYRYASDGDYFACADRALGQVVDLLNGRRISQPMKYISNILLAAAIALLVNYVRARVVSGASKASNSEWLSSMTSGFDFTDISIRHTHNTREYSPQSSGSSDSSGGGGGSSGGGGGHGF